MGSHFRIFQSALHLHILSRSRRTSQTYLMSFGVTDTDHNDEFLLSFFCLAISSKISKQYN